MTSAENGDKSPSILRVEIEITAKDIFVATWWHPSLLWLNLAICFAGFVLTASIASFNEGAPANSLVSIAFTLLLIVFWGGTYLVMQTFAALLTFLQVRGAPGVLGHHTIELRDDGLAEETEANQTLFRWKALKRITKGKSYILVRVSSWLFHVIPRRAFSTEEAYDRFFEELLRRVGEVSK